MAPERITDPDEIRRLVAEHGRWWHEIELSPGIVTPGDDSLLLPDGRVTTLEKVDPVLTTIPLWQAYPGDSLNGDFTNCFAPNARALAVALEESQFRVEGSRTVSMGGYVRATAVSDART